MSFPGSPQDTIYPVEAHLEFFLSSHSQSSLDVKPGCATRCIGLVWGKSGNPTRLVTVLLVTGRMSMWDFSIWLAKVFGRQQDNVGSLNGEACSKCLHLTQIFPGDHLHSITFEPLLGLCNGLCLSYCLLLLANHLHNKPAAWTYFRNVCWPQDLNHTSSAGPSQQYPYVWVLPWLLLMVYVSSQQRVASWSTIASLDSVSLICSDTLAQMYFPVRLDLWLCRKAQCFWGTLGDQATSLWAKKSLQLVHFHDWKLVQC